MYNIHYMSTVYNRIRVLRVSKGLSQQELANRVGANRQTIGYLERQEYNPSIGLSLKIAEALEVSVTLVFSLKPFASITEVLDQSRNN